MHQALKNYINLSTIQGLNMIIPLISYPLIINRIGLISFGELALLQAIFGISSVFNVFGTNYTAVRSISLNKNNNRILSNIIISTLLIRLTNLIISVSVIVLLNFVFSFSENIDLVFFSMGFIAFEAFVPTWYYQGFEKMFRLSVFNLFIKTSFLLTIYLFLNESNIELVPKAMLVPTLFVSIYTVFIIIRTHVSFKFLKMGFLKIFVVKSSQLFVASLFSALYTLSNKIIIGMTLSKEILGMYEIADKISIVLKTPVQMISKALLPNLSQDEMKSRKKFYTIGLVFVIVLVSVTYIFSPILIELVGGNKIELSIDVLRILVLSTPFVLVSLFNLDLFLVLENRFKEIIWIRFSTLLFYIITMSSYIIIFKEETKALHLAYIYLSTEIFTSILSLIKKQ